MEKLSRREFLRFLSIGLGTLTIDQVITACNENQQPISSALSETPIPSSPSQTPLPSRIATNNPIKTRTPAVTSAVENPQITPTRTPQGFPDMVVARGGDPEELVRRSLAALGGMQRFVTKGAKVIIKPNICIADFSYEYAATTNPWVVASLVKLCLEAGAASVRVMDTPFSGTAQEAYVKSGIQEQVKAAGGEMAFMPGFKYVSVDIPNGKDLRKTEIFDDILKADVLINVPIAKHHNLAGLTLGMKNLMGVIRNRSAMHQNIGQRLSDLTSRIPPTLTVVDAIRILSNHGPRGGNLNDVKKLDTLIVAQDIVAADSYAATLFGQKPSDVSAIKAGAAMGLGQSDLSRLRIEELALSV
jgi:uncharacterized protein (DUF362 family)